MFKFKKFFLHSLIMTLCAVCFTSCGDDDDEDEPLDIETASIVGNWKSVKVQVPGYPGSNFSDFIKWELSLLSDGSCTYTQWSFDEDDGWESQTYSGKYSIIGKKLNFTLIPGGIVQYTIQNLTTNTLVVQLQDMPGLDIPITEEERYIFTLERQK